MILIIGGSYQGKLSWAVSRYGIKENEILDLAVSDPLPGYGCYTHFESLTRRYDDVSQWLPLFNDAVVISRELGCGVVPMDAEERVWRERHGVLLKKIASGSDGVVRIFCGLPEVLK